MVGISNGPRPFPSERSEQGGVVWGTGQDVVARNVIRSMGVSRVSRPILP